MSVIFASTQSHNLQQNGVLLYVMTIKKRCSGFTWRVTNAVKGFELFNRIPADDKANKSPDL